MSCFPSYVLECLPCSLCQSVLSPPSQWQGGRIYNRTDFQFRKGNLEYLFTETVCKLSKHEQLHLQHSRKPKLSDGLHILTGSGLTLNIKRNCLGGEIDITVRTSYRWVRESLGIEECGRKMGDFGNWGMSHRMVDQFHSKNGHSLYP